MKIARLDTYIVSVPYRHRENSARVRRDGVTAVLVRLTSDDGLVGWGECCPGPNIESIDAIVRAAAPLLLFSRSLFGVFCRVFLFVSIPPRL